MGQNPDSFWGKTPLEVQIIMQAARSAEIRQHNQIVWAIWHVAAFMRLKRLPKLATLQVKDTSRQKRPQTWQEQMHIMDLWVAATAESAVRKRTAK